MMIMKLKNPIIRAQNKSQGRQRMKISSNANPKQKVLITVFSCKP